MLEAAQVLESNIERLNQGLRDVQQAIPIATVVATHGVVLGTDNQGPLIGLDRRRRVTFWEPEVEPDPVERSYRGVLGQSSKMFPASGDRVLLSSQRQENMHPPGRPVAYPNAKSSSNYPLEPSIKDVETWLDWWAHQLDMPCWWTELTTIPGVEDPRKLAKKIWASFLIPAVRSKVFQGQGHTAPHAPKCLTQNMFLQDELSYQDMRQQPFLLNVAYVQGLKYWVERLDLPVDPDFCPWQGVS